MELFALLLLIGAALVLKIWRDGRWKRSAHTYQEKANQLSSEFKAEDAKRVGSPQSRIDNTRNAIRDLLELKKDVRKEMKGVPKGAKPHFEKVIDHIDRTHLRQWRHDRDLLVQARRDDR